MSITRRFKKRFYLLAASYFRFFADFSLKRWRPRIIAVTGSAGKTTMLNLLEAELGDKAHYSHDANSAFGVAFDILGLRGITGSKLHWLTLFIATPFRSLFFTHSAEFYVVEIDGERPHEVNFLAKWLKPEVTIWVSLGRSHASFFEAEVRAGKFKNIDEAIADEFSKLPQNTENLVLIDGNSPLMVATTDNLGQKRVKLSKDFIKKYEVFPEKTIFSAKNGQFIFNSPQPRDVSIQLAMLDALMNYLGLPLSYDLSGFVSPPGRSSFFQGKNGLKLVDSSYNAHIISMASVLEMSREMRSPRKWLVIGDIIDQGSLTSGEHQKLAELLLQSKAEQILLVGKRTRQYTFPLLKDLKAESFLTPQDALKYIEKNAKNGETLIFKGSQYLEWIIEKLLANPSDAALLPRRELAAIKRREARGLK
jgi:UDP-N-acetylmuramoyl-tripeptide--D-alanyl-D-alanine ligase